MPVNDKINQVQQLSSDKMVLTESGYMEIYVNNEAQTPVYFDNLSVTRSSGNAVEVNAYYPYGMIIPLLSDHEIEGFNAYKFSAKELQEMTGWYDHGWRMLDPTIGRWMCPDPLAEKYYSTSPYAYAGNNPVRNIDPNGLDWYTIQEELYEDRNSEDENDEDDEDEDGNKKTRTRYVYYSGKMSQEQMDEGGYTHVGETISFDNGDGTYTNFYQNVGLKSEHVFDAKGYMLDNGLVGKYAYDEKSPLDMYARVDLAQASIHKGQDNFLNATGDFLNYLDKGKGSNSGFRMVTGTAPIPGFKGGSSLKGGKLVQKMGRAKGNMTGNHAVQNQQAKDIAKKLDLNETQTGQLHDLISGQGYSYQEALQEAKSFFNK